MKRAILIIIGSVLCLRMAVGFISSLGRSTGKMVARVEDPLGEKLPASHSYANMLAIPAFQKVQTNTVSVAQNAAAPAITMAAPPVLTPEKPKKGDSEKAKKEKARRKKRKKKLEELANKEKEKAQKLLDEQQHQIPQVANGNGTKPDSGSDPISNSGFPVGVNLLPKPSPTPIGVSVTPNSKSVDIASLTAALVSHPTVSDFDKLTSDFRNRQITASQFYGALRAMVQSSMSDSRKFAVQGADLFRRRESFEILANESFAEKDALIQSQASIDLEKYQDVSQISVLSQVLSISDIFSKTRAADIVGHIALNMHSTPNLTGLQLHGLFDATVALLTPLSTDHSSPEASNLAILAQNALTNIRNLFQGTPA